MLYIGSMEYDEQLKKADRIIVFGGGAMLPRLLQKMKRLNLAEKIVAICDNDAKRQGEKIEGIPVLGVEYACKEHSDADFIVYNHCFTEISEQLQENHIEKIHLIRQGTL